MLSDDVKDEGFVLLCCSLPLGDCTVRTVDEARVASRRRTTSAQPRLRTDGCFTVQEELLSLQMHSGAL